MPIDHSQRTRHFRALVILSAALALVPSALSQNLLTNGGFEVVSPALGTGSSDNFRYLSDGDATTLPGWQAEDDGVGERAYVFNTTRYATGAGSNGLSSNQGTAIRQDVSLVAGRSYRFSMLMSLANPNASPYDLEVTCGTANHRFSRPAGSSADFESMGFVFTATASGVATLRIANDAPAGDFKGYAIDEVAIDAVPEPGSLVALSLGAVGALRRRRRLRQNQAS